MKRFLFAICFLSFSLIIRAQTIRTDWVKTWESYGGNSPFPSVVSSFTIINAFEYSNGDLLILGSVNLPDDTIDVDPGPGKVLMSSTANEKDFAIRLDPKGNFIAAYRFGRPKNGSYSTLQEVFAFDKDGYLYVSGNFDDTLKYSDNSTVNRHFTKGKYDGYLIKYDQTFNVDWFYQLGGSGRDYIRHIHLDQHGDLLLSGSFEDSIDFSIGGNIISKHSAGGSDALLIKMNSNKNIEWAHSWESKESYESVRHTRQQPVTKNIFVQLNIGSDSIDLDPGPNKVIYPHRPHYNGFTIILDSLGNYLSFKDSTGHALNSFLVGDTMIFNGCRYKFKYNFSTLDTAWIRRYKVQSTSCESCASTIDEFGNSYSAFCFVDTIDVDPGPGIQSRIAIGTDIAIVKLDRSGNLVWDGIVQMDTSYVFSPGTNPFYSRAMFIGQAQDVYLAGFISAGYDFDIGPNTLLEYPRNVTYRSFLLKLTYKPVGIEEKNEVSNASLYPNPSNGQVTLDLERPKGRGTVLIYNQLGQLKSQLQFINQSQLQFELPAEKGLYFIQVNSDEGSEVFKVVRTD